MWTHEVGQAHRQMDTGVEGAADPNSLVAPAGRGLELMLLSLAVSASSYALTIIGPLQEAMRISLALSDNQTALLQGPTRALPSIIAAIPFGLLIDRYSRIRLLFVFSVLNVVASIGAALAPNFALLFISRCLVGLGGAATLIGVISLIADLYAPAQRGRAIMVIGIGQVGGTSAAFALGGALLAIFGSGSNGWRWAMLWLSCPLVAVIGLVLAMREPMRRGVAIQGCSARRAFAELWRYRAVIAALLSGLVIVDIAFGAAYIWAAPAFSRRFALSSDRIGAIMALVLLVGGVLGPITGGVLADLSQRTGGPRRTGLILSAMAFVSIPEGLFAVAPSVTVATVALAMLLTIVPAISLMVTTLCTVIVPNEVRGLGTALLTAASQFFGYALAPLVVSLLSGALGGPDMIGEAVSLVCVTASILGSAIFACGSRHFPHAAVPDSEPI